MINNHFSQGQLVLDGCRKALFKGEGATENISDVAALVTEAESQTVFPLVYSAFEKLCDMRPFSNKFYGYITHNARIIAEHKAIYSLLSKNDIPAVFLKGCTSAHYYPDPLLRTLGDVDLLVKEADLQKAATLLQANSYIQAENENDRLHLAFINPKNKLSIELHRAINGIPENDYGNKIAFLFSDIFENSVFDSNGYIRPSDFHHGLILLLHNASHLTKEGLGLRHFCDWAVFVAHFSNDRFCELFEASLKATGLWKFAQISTAFAIKYLGLPAMAFCEDVDDEILKSLCTDIFNGGNFGKKDFTRSQHIKYIQNHREHTISQENSIKRLFSNLDAKARELPLVKKVPLTLCLGYVYVVIQYFWLIIRGKRKFDNKALRNSAKSRKALYSSFELFK